MKNYKVSIVIPVYNGAKYVEEAINSALNQTYKNKEIIVVNDGSTDKTEEICLRYKDKIKYFYKKNGGVSTALNMAIENMSGDYFSWLSHDDVYFPNKIEEEIKAIKNNKEIILSNFVCIDSNSNELFKVDMNSKKINANSLYGILSGSLNGITLLIPKEAFNICGKFNPELNCTQDYDMWFKMIKNGYKLKHINQYLAKSRQHIEQTTYVSPNTLAEGNKLWINFIDNISFNEVKNVYDSEYEFYILLLKNLYSTGYSDAFKYLKKRISSKYSKIKVVKDIVFIKLNSFFGKFINLIKRAMNRPFKENIKKVISICKK